MSLPSRPFLHCSTPPVVFCVVAQAIHCFWGSKVVLRAGFIVLVAFLSHHLRDAHRRGLWLPPFSDALAVSYAAYVCSVLFLPNLVRMCLLNYPHFGGNRSREAAAEAVSMTEMV